MLWLIAVLVHLIGWMTLSWTWFFGILALDFAFGIIREVTK